MSAYNQAVKVAKSAYMCQIVSSNSHKPEVLFNVLNYIVNPREYVDFQYTIGLCEKFLTFFTEKKNALSALPFQ